MINDKTGTPKLTMNGAPLQAFNFLVSFLGVGSITAPNPLDIRFQRVSGIGLNGTMNSERIGGRQVRLPEFPTHENLTLERGYVVGSPLRLEIEAKFADLEFQPRNVLVVLFDTKGSPMVSWLFYNAVPTRWAMGELNASQSGVFIETIELSYTRFQPISL
ncbi:phage tail protein [Microscilla marina]|uniref:Afp5 n=1 Tax=Microscilla marina ATCC 23134 TaxID=313606 RepID=A1ZC07_MICM2|nr:phage tail protein [Microscilla marina]EAY31809.1 Afp5 [Microscilla marina ATCC 23134]